MERETAPPPAPKGGSKKLVVILGVSFLVLFTCSNVAMSYTTTLHGDSGFLALGLMYVTFAAGTVVAPVVFDHLGARKMLLVSSITYTLMIVSVGTPYPLALYAGYFANGIGAGWIWVAQGVYVARVAEIPALMGEYQGLFYAVYLGNLISGNVLTIILDEGVGLTPTVTILVFGALSVIPFGMFFFVKEVAGESKEKQSVSQIMAGLKKIAVDKRFYVFALYFCSQGVQISLTYGPFPPIAGVKLIPYFFLIYGATVILGSYGWGRMIDVRGMRPVLLIHLVTMIVAYVLAAMADNSKSMTTLMICAFFLGWADSGSNILCVAIATARFEGEDTTYAFSLRMLCYAIATAGGFFLTLGAGWWATIAVAVASTLIGAALAYAPLRKSTPEAYSNLDEAKSMPESGSGTVTPTPVDVRTVQIPVIEEEC